MPQTNPYRIVAFVFLGAFLLWLAMLTVQLLIVYVAIRQGSRPTYAPPREQSIVVPSPEQPEEPAPRRRRLFAPRAFDQSL